MPKYPGSQIHAATRNPFGTSGDEVTMKNDDQTIGYCLLCRLMATSAIELHQQCSKLRVTTCTAYYYYYHCALTHFIMDGHGAAKLRKNTLVCRFMALFLIRSRRSLSLRDTTQNKNGGNSQKYHCFDRYLWVSKGSMTT